MPATQDLDITVRDGILIGLPVNGDSVIYANTLICIDPDGYARPGVDSPGMRFVGLSNGALNATGYSDGELTLEVRQGISCLLTGSGFARTNVGDAVYLIDDATVGLIDDASVDDVILVGWIEEFVSATQAWVRLATTDPTEAGQHAQQWTVEVPGTDTAAYDLTGPAENYGGSDFVIDEVVAVRADVTSSGNVATPHRLVETTHWTLAAGVLTGVDDQSANTLTLTFRGRLQP
jgi:hypothetical protein